MTGAQAEEASVVSTIEAPDGRVVAQAESNAEVPPRGNAVIQQSINVRHPQLWSLERPALYTLRTQVLRDGAQNLPIRARLARWLQCLADAMYASLGIRKGPIFFRIGGGG